MKVISLTTELNFSLQDGEHLSMASYYSKMNRYFQLKLPVLISPSTRNRLLQPKALILIFVRFNLPHHLWNYRCLLNLFMNFSRFFILKPAGNLSGQWQVGFSSFLWGFTNHFEVSSKHQSLLLETRFWRINLVFLS